jgi:hypothetical protein
MLMGLYIIGCNFRSTSEARYSTNQLVNVTVGSWWKVTLGVREHLNVGQFFDIIGGSSALDVKSDSLIDLLERAQVRQVLGDGMAHVLALLLDGNKNSMVSADELHRHLWNVPGLEVRGYHIS